MKSIAFTLLLALSQTLVALTVDDDAVQDCQNQTIALQRLNCYDNLLNAPIHPVEIPKPPVPRTITIIDHINIQEQQRTPEDDPLLLNSQMEDADSGQQQVIITTPALGAIGIRPILAISCQRNITQLRIVLPEPIKSHTIINVTLLDETNQPRIQAPWRVSGTGRIITTGRGMDSIHTIRALLRTQHIQLQSDQPLLDGLRFDLTGLTEQLPVLASACHWNPRGSIQP